VNEVFGCPPKRRSCGGEMKRKVLALAISQLFVPCVFAQGSSVTVYGTFNVDFENVERDGATNPPDAGNSFVPSSAVLGSPITGADLESRNRVSSNSSNIGLAILTSWARTCTRPA
jgi:hypothetical protein